MYIAVDRNNRPVFIEHAVLGREYYCPLCRRRMSPRITGEKRQHCFAHLPNEACSDSWAKDYEMSEWHRDWQSAFPIINQEVVVAMGYIRHRADVLVGSTVIEFQNSALSAETFNNRNAFYRDLGYKVVWLFNLIDEVDSGKLTPKRYGKKIKCEWPNPKRVFKGHDIAYGEVDLFFQLYKNGGDCIVKVDLHSDRFKSFTSDSAFSRNGFLDLFKIQGQFPRPFRSEIVDDREYINFKRKYNLELNDQQERAVLAVDGAVLVLAVPGSGKTTTLISRIGYMVRYRGIKGTSILALTYTKKAAEDMNRRYREKFGKNDGVEFRTINSLCKHILDNYFKLGKYTLKKKKKNDVLKRIYKELHPFIHPTEADIKTAGTTISYIKNMMLGENEIRTLRIWDKNAWEVYERYCEKLRKNDEIDFDDQIVYAYQLLKKNIEILDRIRRKYVYICIDEAQDTSRVQYELIRLLVGERNNIFMVGDEDQSIYRFRAAYPEGMLNFNKEYLNPYVLRIEKNYRSTKEIVDMAADFIAKNRNRVPKEMVSQRGNGRMPEKISVRSRDDQYQSILDIAQRSKGKQIAFLYRENICAYPIADRMMKAGVDFSIKRNDDSAFFHDHVVEDIRAFMRLAITPDDIDAFKQIYNKISLYIKKQDCDGICKKARYERKTISESMRAWLSWGNRRDGYKADRFEKLVNSLAGMEPREAIEHLLQNGYGAYLDEKGIGRKNTDILKSIARDDRTFSDFFNHLDQLESCLKEHEGKDASIILSTIHSSKGLEYEAVYIVDLFDGMFPSLSSEGTREDQIEQEQEERRLFYVAMTRAKDELYFYSIMSEKSMFLEELFPYRGRSLEGVFRNNLYEEIFVKNTRCEKVFVVRKTYITGYEGAEVDPETGEIGTKESSKEFINAFASCPEWEKYEVKY